MARMFRAEPPFWLRTLTRMGELGTLDVSASAHRRGRLLASPSDAAASGSARSSSGGSVVAEVPNHPPGDVRIQAALDSVGSLGRYQQPPSADLDPRDPLGLPSTSSLDGTYSVPPVSVHSGTQ